MPPSIGDVNFIKVNLEDEDSRNEFLKYIEQILSPIAKFWTPFRMIIIKKN